MPLIKSPSKKAREENIKREIDAGKDPKQAAAIGYSVQRRSKGKAGGEERSTSDGHMVSHKRKEK